MRSLCAGEPADLAHVDDEGHGAVAEHRRAEYPFRAPQSAAERLNDDLEPVDDLVDHDAEPVAVHIDDRDLIGRAFATDLEGISQPREGHDVAANIEQVAAVLAPALLLFEVDALLDVVSGRT